MRYHEIPLGSFKVSGILSFCSVSWNKGPPDSRSCTDCSCAICHHKHGGMLQNCVLRFFDESQDKADAKRKPCDKCSRRVDLWVSYRREIQPEHQASEGFQLFVFVWNLSGTAVSTFHWFPVQAMLQCHGPCWLVFSKANTLQNRYFAEVVYVLGLVGIDRNAKVRECHLLLHLLLLYAECWWLLELYSVTVPKFWNLQNSWYVSFQDEVNIQAIWKFWNSPTLQHFFSSLRLCGRCWKDASGGVPDGDAESCAKNTSVLVFF